MPARKPESFSMIGFTTSSVVPGYVELSSTISCPGCTYGPMALAVFSMYVMSGSRFAFSGVGTHMISASASEALRKSSVARSGFCCCPTARAMRSPAMCLM